MLKIIIQYVVKHITTLPIKTVMWVFNVLTCIITSITACPIRFAVILVIMCVSTFKNGSYSVFLYIQG
jgi:hypothetical protein